MTEAVANILAEAEQLSIDERAELADKLVESLAHNVPPVIEAAQISEIQRRIAQVEAGKVTIIPGDEALARVRQLVASARIAS
jgi:putative addiction module component (TIGR02574 family)